MLLRSGGWLLPAVVGIVFMVSASIAQDQRSNGPIISPNVTELILQMGQNFTLTCKGKNKLEFMQQEPAEDNLGSFCINKTESVSMDGNQFETKLDLYNIDQFAIGYYACFYSSFNGSLLLNNITEELKNTDQISFIYIYVNGTESLYAPMREFIIPRSEYTVVIECRPTTPDVEVTLMSDNADDYEYERYNPKVGFVLDLNSDTELGSQQIMSYTCGFQRQHIQDTKIIFVEPHQIQPPPQPNIKQKKIPFMDGDTFSINCTVIYNDIPVNLSWETPASVPLETKSELNNKYSVQKGKLYYTALTITNASILHQGTYTCVSTNFNPNSKRISATTKYYAKPVLELKLFPKRAGNMVEYNVKEVNQITFSVAVSAYPPIKDYKFLKDGRMIQSDNLKYTINKEISGDLNLYINHISVRDSGNYTFVANNMCRKDNIYTKCLEKSLSLEIRVKDAPIVHFNSNSNKKYVTKNTRTSLECVAEGYPLPVIEWRFTDETGLVNGSIKKYWSKLESLYKLSSIVDVNATMSGNITCSASNSEGVGEANQTLLVYDIPDGFGIKNRELSWFPEETDVELTCLASKYKFKNITWTTDVQDLNFKVEYPNETLSLVAMIKIEKIRLDQNGTVFTCHGFNLDNSTQTESISLTVEALQTLAIEEPMDAEQFFYPRETSVHLTCIAKGVPPPEIMWYKDDIPMSNNETMQVYLTTEAIDHSRINSSMRLSDMKSVKGKYKCVAKSHGMKQKKVYNVLPFQAMSKTYTQILIPIIVIIFLLILLVLYLILKVKKEKRFRKELAAAGLLYFVDGVPTSLNPELGIDEQAELLPYNNKYEFPPEKLILGKQLGAGAFGVVYKAEARGIINAEETTIVAVKMVKKTADNMFIKALTSELKIMLYLGKHVNIVNLLGACTKNVGKRELSVIVEYCKFGNIHNYMQKHREVFIDQLTDNSEKTLGKVNRGFSSSSASTGIHSEYCDSNITQETDHTFLNTANTGRSTRKDNAIHQEESVKVSEGYVQPEWRSNYETDYFEGRVPRPLFSRDLLCWSFQIARGMEYLASRKILHGDLAARNVLLADDNVVKICDFGLARNIYNNDEYQKKENSPLPVKWLAIECMTDRIFSTQSDVWSFGIVLWEIFSLAKTPYPNIAPSGLLQWLVQGHRLEKPPYADDRLYDVMRQCWQEKPTMRPSFTQLQEILGSFLEDNVRNHYVDLNTVCMASNVKMDGQEDYLDMVCAPDYKNMVTPSPHHYVNQNERFFPPTPTKIDPEGYLQMSPAVSDGVFSPRSQAIKFDFDAQKYNSRTSEASSCGSELTPMLTLNNLPARSGSESEHEGNVSPHIHLCPPIEEETDEVFEKQNNAKNLQNNCIVQNTGITNLMYIKLDDIKNEKKPNDITNHYINIPNGLVT